MGMSEVERLMNLVGELNDEVARRDGEILRLQAEMRAAPAGLTEWDVQVLVDGFQGGDVDHFDLFCLLKDPVAWVAESMSGTAEAIRKGRVA